MLRIDLAALRDGPVRTQGEVTAAALDLSASEAPLKEPVQVDGRLSGAGEGRYYWHARFRATVLAECRRCLAPVEPEVSEELTIVFAQGKDASEEDGYRIISSREKHLDLAPALREELLLALPRYAECRPDCKGLCPRCGSNLNEGPCGCEPAADPRWAALRAHLPGPSGKD
jgi:uncharacterized protein